MLLYAPWPFLNNLLNLLVILGSKPIMLSLKLIYDGFESNNLTQLISKTLIISDDLIWEALTRCLVNFGAHAMSIFQGIQIGVNVQL
jgi:hypothetical protein